MEYVNLGGSDLQVSKVILGTWALGGFMWGGTEANDSERAIRASLEAGVTTIDTAPVYGFGLSEELVGVAIRGRRDDVVVATKFGLRWPRDDRSDPSVLARITPQDIYRCAQRQSIYDECDRSLRRLGVDVIDLYQCHWPDPETEEEEVMEALLTLQEKGKIRAFGVSNFSVAMLEKCLQTAPVVSVQPPYSLLRRNIEADILPYCDRNAIGVIVYSPMFRGLLTGKITADYAFQPGDNRGRNPWFQGDKLMRVNGVLQDVVAPIAERHDATLAQVAVAWCLAQAGVTAALVGARNGEQAAANARGADVKLTAAEAKTIGDAFGELQGRK